LLRRKNSIFRRLLVTFMTVGTLTGVPLVLLAIKFNKDSASVRLEQSVGQQIVIITDYFQREFSIGLQRSLKEIAESDALRDYLSASGDDRIIAIKRLESNLIRLQKQYPDYASVYYADADGEIIVSVGDGQRNIEIGNLAVANDTETNNTTPPTLTHLTQLYRKIKTAPVLLSSGNMEWFMPPREVVIDGPFVDEKNRLTILAALPTIDLDNGGFGGLVIIKIQMDSFVKRLQEVKFYQLNPIWLFDGSGNLLVAPPEKSLGLDPTALVKRENAKTLKFHRTDEGLIGVQDLFIEKEKTAIRLAYSIPSSLILKDYQSAIYYFLLALLISLAIVGILAFYVSRKFSNPIIQLANAAARLAEGALSTRVTVSASGELRTLVDSFNAMSSRLQLAYENRNKALDVLKSTITQMRTDWQLPLAPGNLSAHESLKQSITSRHLADTDDLNEIARVIDRLLVERGQNLRETQEAKRLADEANRAKGDFLATMSHEIRTPLNAVIGMSDLLGTTELSEKQKNLVFGMQSAGEQLLQIINDILDFSRLQAGRIELNDMAIDLNAFMGRLMLLVGGLPNASKLDIKWLIDASVPQSILGDDARLMQILTNLVGNSVKFTKEGSIRIDVLTAKPVGGIPMIQFRVSDSGPGISAELRAHIFDPFRQGSAERLRPHAGAGLGLAICRKLVMAMGGRIELVPDVAKGACFLVELPLRLVEQKPQGITTTSTETPAFRPLRILVAEDTPANQLVVQLMLRGQGHEVTVVENGAEAVEAFRGTLFDVVLLDLQMPVMDGYEAARQIRLLGNEGRTVPIAALTAFTQDSDRSKAAECGISHFLSKPIRAKDVAKLLETMLAEGWLQTKDQPPQKARLSFEERKDGLLIQSVYSSVATEPMPKSKLYKILVQARLNNKLSDVTGLLVFVEGMFLQVLEGKPEVVSSILEKISNDRRHKDINILYKTTIEQRTFPTWQMAYLSPSPKELAAWAGLRNTTTLETTLATLEREPNRVPSVLLKLLQAIPENDLQSE